jgi:hypothetical protein
MTCEDREWLLDALISEMGIWGREECGEGSRTLPTANGKFLRILVSLKSDARSGARIVRFFRVENNHDLSCCHLLVPD